MYISISRKSNLFAQKWSDTSNPFPSGNWECAVKDTQVGARSLDLSESWWNGGKTAGFILATPPFLIKIESRFIMFTQCSSLDVATPEQIGCFIAIVPLSTIDHPVLPAQDTSSRHGEYLFLNGTSFCKPGLAESMVKCASCRDKRKNNSRELP
jgi:hypothetical protein